MLELNKVHKVDVMEGMRQLEDNSIDLIITSPPYNKAGLNGHKKPILKTKGRKGHAVNTTIDLFGRVKSTEQAEMITTVLYSYDQLVRDKNQISDLDVYNYVFDWKPHWKNQKEFEVCDTIQNLAMLSLMNITHSGKLQDTTLL